jgi:poly-gamma-glutamate capsule biosynthesis protein CapA/YwtB (metallophosphatase superfamily)
MLEWRRAEACWRAAIADASEPDGAERASRLVAPTLTVALAGDVMLGRGVNRMIAEHGSAYPWGDVLAAVWSADRFLINLECALTDHTERWSDGHKPFYFRANPQVIETLRVAGVDFASLANNHAADFGMTGLLDTVRCLDEAGIARAGAGGDILAARAPAIVTAAEWRIGVVAFADHPAVWAAETTSPGINYTPVSLASGHFGVIEDALTIARRQADMVIFSMHWGPNMRARPTPAFRAFARHVIEAGADVFWGHSAHIVQGVEVWHGKPILYDTGDFVDDYAVDPELRNDLSGLFLLRARPPAIAWVDVIPVVIGSCQVNRARGAERDWFVERFSTLCAERGTEVLAAGEALKIPVGAAPRRGAEATA